MPDQDRPLPQALESEVALLGGLLIDGGREIHSIRTVLFDGVFYSPTHGKIYKAIIALSDAGEAIDPVTVAAQLERHGHLEECGGNAYVYELTDAVATSATVETHAHFVREAALKRRLMEAAHALYLGAQDRERTSDELMVEAGMALSRIKGLVAEQRLKALGDIMPEALEHLDRVSKREPVAIGYATGLGSLANYIQLRKAELVVIGGRPSMGKTSLALQMALHLSAEAALPCAFFSLEMGELPLAERSLLSRTRRTRHDLWGADRDTAWDEIVQEAASLRRCGLFVDDSGDHNVFDIRSEGRRLKREHDIVAVFVDYMQIVKPSRKRYGNRETEVAEISQQLKAMAKELGVCVVAMAQLNRAGEDTPKIEYLRESGAIEQDADIVALIHRSRKVEGLRSEAEIIVGKNRNGATGSVPLWYYPCYTLFEDMEERDVEEV